MATAELTPVKTVDDWIQSNPEAPADRVVEVLKGQLELVRAESRMLADVDIDGKGNLKPKNLAGIYRLGKMFSMSQLVPEHFQNRPEDCTIAIQMALRCGVDILTFLQSCYIVYGRPGIEAKLAIAMINSSGKIKGRIRWKMEGEGTSRKCTAIATDADTGEEITESVDWQMVKAEGWDSKKGSKWMTIPELMFKYRSAMWLIRLNYPDVLMGMKTVDELEDIIDVEPTKPAGDKARTLDQLTDQLNGNRSEPVGTVSHVGPEAEEESEEETEPETVNGEIMEEATEGEAGTEQATEQAEQPKDPLAGVTDRMRACKTKKQIQDIAREVRASHQLSTGDDMRLDSFTDDFISAL